MGEETGVRITLAGRVGVERDGVTVADQSLPRGQVRLAFAVLVLERHQMTSRHDLADRLWPEQLPESWESAVRNVVTRLRQALAASAAGIDDLVVHTADGYAAQLPANSVVDIEEAEADVANAERLLSLGQPSAAADLAARATATLRLPVLPGIEGTWADGVRAKSDDLHRRALELWAGASLVDERFTQAVAAASEAVERTPFNENAHRLLMRSHAANGNRAEALRAYGRCRQLLVEEMGINPSAETEQVYLELLLEDQAAESGSESAATNGHGAGASSPQHELVGRERELAELTNAIGAAPIVTLCGPGGVGKTRLAAALAQAERDRSDRVVRWVELASVDEAGVDAAVAGAVGEASVGVDALDVAVAALRATPSLLVLDNCEHVIGRASRVAATLVSRCADLRLLVTSRAPLGVGGEHVLRLEPLELPDEGDDQSTIDRSPAVALFTQRAAEVRSDFSLDSTNAPIVAEICRRLDGMPLAIELAASQVRVMPVTDIAQRLGDRFRLLRSHRRDVDPRHQSLSGAIEWSYELLDPAERELFDRLAVFPGSFSLGGAHAVAGHTADELDTLELLGSLVDQSMIVPITDDEARFSLLESVREYGRSRLGDGPDGDVTHRRFIEWELELAERAAIGIRGADEAIWVRRVDGELRNLVAAFHWAAVNGQVDHCIRTVVALFDYAFYRIRHEIGVLASEAVALDGAEHHQQFGEVAAAAGYLAWQRGLLREAEACLAVAMPLGESWLTHDALGTIRMFQGDVESAITAYERASELVEDEPYRLAITLSQRTFASVYAGRHDALELAALSEAAAADAKNPTASAQAAWATGIVHLDLDPELALLRLERCMQLAKAVGNRLAHGAASVPAQEVRNRVGRRTAFDDLRAALAEIESMQQTGNTATQGLVLRRLVWRLADIGLNDHAAVIAGAEATASQNLPLRPKERSRHEAVLATLRERLGSEEYERLSGRGSALSSDELVTVLAAVRTAIDEQAQPPS